MNLRYKLKLFFTDSTLGKDILMRCNNCKKKTIHSEHGFRGSNYRLQCKECGGVNYCEVSF